MTDLLFIHWNVDPVIFRLFGLEIRWYSLLFVSGFIIGWYIFRWFFRREGVPEKLLDPLLYTLLICTIVGARLGHCLFYQPDYYLGSWEGFWEIFMPWKGGLASHGGTIALVLGMIWFARKYGRKEGFDFFWLVDRLCITICFAGALIRIGNLFNSEIYGDVTTLPWGVVFERNGETEPKHPTQIYEALSYIILGLVLLWMYVKKIDRLNRGTIFGIFFTVLFGMRFIIEFIKEPQVGFEENMVLNMGQLLSIPFIVAGIVILIWSIFKGKPSAIDKPQPVHNAPKPAPKTNNVHSLQK
ncbi:MAG: prolipoprotein diacylglyceryl transferase [Bacteroidales bacterium]|nr:prolipoprotein diacylglyceryl transferase [Bacteroidales bacterium]